MSDVQENTVIPPLIMPIPELQPKESMENRPPPQIYKHGPGDYCFYCSCVDCKMFFGNGKPIHCVNPRTLEVPPTPRYGYLGLVNAMRAAAAKREEERQNRLQAERNGTAGVKSPKKEKVSTTPKPKTLRQTIKRRRV